jgi:hypothetical protein
MFTSHVRGPLIGVLLASVLSGCSAPSITLAVAPIIVPAETTAGTVCYAAGEAATTFRIRSATYRADATFRSDGAVFEVSDEVEVRIFGRATAPGSSCVAAGDDDIVLGGPFTLTLDEPRRVVVGEGAAGETLAQLVNGGPYWIGVALDAGLSLGGTRTITFDEGRVTLTF